MAEFQLTRKTDLRRLRKIALDRQGLMSEAPFGRGKNAARRAIEQIGYVQIDTISVVERAHNHVWRSRVPNFTRHLVDKLIADGSIFEYWAHAASFLPMRDFRFYEPMKRRFRTGEEKWIRSRDTKLMNEVIARISAEGALKSRDLEDTRTTRAGWWDWKPAKRAVEQLWMQGDLMISARDGFQKSYDLTERVLPGNVATSMPSVAESAEFLLDQELRCHGFVTLKGITYGRRGYPELRKAVKETVDERVAAGRLDVLSVPNKQKFFATPGLLDCASLRANRTVRLLSPFDNAVIQRDRLISLFDFDYQIECYVPEPKRRYGYFCLPIMYRDEFVGRADCKAHRKTRLLEIKHLQVHEERIDGDFPQALAAALPAFVEFQECDEISLSKTTPGAFHRTLGHHLRR